MIGGRILATQFNGKNYAYLVGYTKIFRYEWDGKHITLDTSAGDLSHTCHQVRLLHQHQAF